VFEGVYEFWLGQIRVFRYGNNSDWS
jgi:hypothetical protein